MKELPPGGGIIGSWRHSGKTPSGEPQHSALNKLLGPGVWGTVSGPLTRENWRAELRSTLPDGIVLAERGDIVRFVRPPSEPESSPHYSFDDTSAREAVEIMSRQGEWTIEIDGDLDRRLTMNLRGVPWRHALALAAGALDAMVVRDEEGVYSLRGRKRNEVNLFQALAEARPGTTVTIANVEPRISFSTESPLELDMFSRIVAQTMASQDPRRSVLFELPHELMQARIMFNHIRGTREDLLHVFADVAGAEIVQDGDQLRVVPRDG